MPRSGRHRTSLPTRLIALVAALLVTIGVAVAAGSAAADSDSGSGGSDSGLLSSSDSGGSEDAGAEDAESSGDDGDESSGDGQNGATEQDGQDGSGAGRSEDGRTQDGQGADNGNADEQRNDDDRRQGEGNSRGNQPDAAGEQKQRQDRLVAAGQRANPDEPFPGRDQIAPAGADDYVDINDVEPNGGNIGEGGQFSGGSYSVDCGVSDHTNSDNYMAAPGKRNGAQHVHDYVGNRTTNANSDEESLREGSTSCVNGDQSVFFWPVVRDLNGTGPDVGKDGGSLDGNVGAILKPRSAQLSFNGHGDEPVQQMPTHLMIIMGNAKAGAQNGANVNAKYTCENTQDRVTDKYPICGETGGRLMRILDYPSCWDGQNLESANLRDHMAFPDARGNCGNGFVPVPALRITLTYDQPSGRDFSIDSFPNEQHAPNTDHSDYENLASEDQSRRGAECINAGLRCANIPRDG